MTARSVVLEQAAELLAQSPTGDISTRAVCEAAGVTQPVLYRMFGDKNGLLVAIVDYVWDQYLSMKRAAERSDDPLVDLYNGWDSHVAFAMANPHAYRLLFATTLSANTEAGGEAMAMLEQNLERLAAQGRLRVQPAEASKLVMAANSGIALALILRGTEYSDVGLSARMRDTLYESLLTTSTARETTNSAASIAATTLKYGLSDGDGRFSQAESSLFNEWLDRFQNTIPSAGL